MGSGTAPAATTEPLADCEAATAGRWTVYLIRTARGRLYTGISTDPVRRFREHRDDPGGRGAKYFLSDRPLAVVY